MKTDKQHMFEMVKSRGEMGKTKTSQTKQKRNDLREKVKLKNVSAETNKRNKAKDCKKEYTGKENTSYEKCNIKTSEYNN